MKTIFRQAALAVVSLFALSACSTDTTAEDRQAGISPVKQPQITVRDVTTTGFSLRWEAVEGAGSYAYSLNGAEEQTTTECRIAFTQLERQTEYTVSIKACPANPDTHKESVYTFVHVLTDQIAQLPTPETLLGCAYASKTVISWTAVADAASYEYEFNGETFTTDKCQVQLSKLTTSTPYTFSVKAVSADQTRFSDSEASSCNFTTEAQDIATLIIAPVNVTSDSVIFDIYATSDVTYYYDVVPASTFLKYTEEHIITAYRQSALDYAAKQGVSIQLAMAALLKAGNSSIQVIQLVPELSYTVFGFGMTTKGEVTTGIYKANFKTPADGYTDGPNFGSADWFSQRYYVTDEYYGLTGYNKTNATFLSWEGQDVSEIRYQVMRAETYKELFPTETSIRNFLEGNNANVAPQATLDLVNSTEGAMIIYEASPGISYTIASLFSSTSGAQVLAVNSATTKTSSATLTWFSAVVDNTTEYGNPYDTLLGAVVGKDVTACSVVLFKESGIKDIPTSRYDELVEEYGTVLEQSKMPYINGGGYGLILGDLDPATTYIFIASATNMSGDKVVRWDNATTKAAPAGNTTVLRNTRAAGAIVPATRGVEVPDLNRFIYPVKSSIVTAQPEPDLWTIIHNMQILK